VAVAVFAFWLLAISSISFVTTLSLNAKKKGWSMITIANRRKIADINAVIPVNMKSSRTIAMKEV
jgi:hypothetical protein